MSEHATLREERIIEVYQCLCHVTRLRILNLLQEGPLCVCHFQTILEEPQVKVSKHLAYLRRHGLIKGEREANWMVYSLEQEMDPVLRENLRCLQAARTVIDTFARDLGRRRCLEADSPLCPPTACREDGQDQPSQHTPEGETPA